MKKWRKNLHVKGVVDEELTSKSSRDIQRANQNSIRDEDGDIYYQNRT